MNYPRVIIVQTTPYSLNYSSRSLDSYFHFWEKKNAKQFFSRNITPQKGHCCELFQITDAELLRRWLHKCNNVGKIYKIEDLKEQGINSYIDDNGIVAGSYKLGRKHTPLIEIARDVLWRKKYWCNTDLLSWLDDFKPEIVFFNFTNNIFLPKIALFIAERYDIPIITAVGDDYYFNDRMSISPFYHYFRFKYKKLIRQIFYHKGAAVYVNDKIKEKYSTEFNLYGETVYFNSTVQRKPFSYIDNNNPKIVYFGNIRLGRNSALIEIADALKKINSKYKLDVYSNEQDEMYFKELSNHSNVNYHGAVPYAEVQKLILDSDIYVIAESMQEKDVVFTKYSLSTKAADGLMSGSAVFAYGSFESGVIEYLKNTRAAVVCMDSKKLVDSLQSLINDREQQRLLYDQSAIIAKQNHTIEGSTATFENVVRRVLNS